jgi:hypothetical protein
MHNDFSLAEMWKTKAYAKLGIEPPPGEPVSLGEVAGSLAAAAISVGFIWGLYSIVQGVRALFIWLFVKDNVYATVASLTVALIGSLFIYVFFRAPRLFASMQMITGVVLGAYFGHTLMRGDRATLEFVSNIIGAVFLFADGGRRLLNAPQQSAKERSRYSGQSKDNEPSVD